jgi:5'(3')-deoxyribonucleotidase
MNRRAAGGADSMLCSVKNVVSADMMIDLPVR